MASRAKTSFVTQGAESLNPAAQDSHQAIGHTPLVLSPVAPSPLLADPGGGEGGGLQPAAGSLQPLQMPSSAAPLHSLEEAAPNLSTTTRSEARLEARSEADTAPVLQGLSSSSAGISAGNAPPTFSISDAEGRGGGGGDGPQGAFGLFVSRAHRFGNACLVPLHLVLRCTCPECAHDSETARLYPITLVTSFSWVAIMSTIIAAVVSRWGELMCVPSSFLGMYIVAIGAEIPDTIQSVTVAKRGYGSMAVSNSTGSQIINILIGLGES